jgi:DNA invertase Pin-like site-specific DNA recombinase
MRAAIYARVSEASRDPRTIRTHELIEYCERHHWTAAAQYVDVGWKFSQLDRLIADAHRAWFDAVIIWRFEKSPLSSPHLLRALDTFDALAIEYVTLADDIDTSTAAGKASFLADLERTLIGEQIKARLRVFHTKAKRTWRNLKESLVRMLRSI